LGLQRLVVQEVLVVFRAICFEIINSISHRIAIVQIVVELFVEEAPAKSQHIPVRWLVKMGAVESRDANTATFDFRHETHHKWNRKSLGEAEFDLDSEVLIDGNSEESGKAFGHDQTALLAASLLPRKVGHVWSLRGGEQWRLPILPKTGVTSYPEKAELSQATLRLTVTFPLHSELCLSLFLSTPCFG